MALPKLKDDALEQHYRAMFDLFTSPGWSALMEQADEIAEGLNQVARVTDETDLRNRQGQLVNLAWLKGLPEVYDFAYKQLLVDDAAPEERDSLLAELEEADFGVAKVVG